MAYLSSPVSFQTTPDDPLEMRTESVGRVQPHVRAKILSPPDETGQRSIVPVGTPGEICVAGYLLQKGYVASFFFNLKAHQRA